MKKIVYFTYMDKIYVLLIFSGFIKKLPIMQIIIVTQVPIEK